MKIYQVVVFLKLIHCSLSLLVSESSDWGSIYKKNDDECVFVNLDNKILLGSETYQTFCVHKNGGVFVNSAENSPTLWAFNTKIVLIDTCTGNQCGLYINTNPSNGVLSTINSLVKNGFSADRLSTFIVTWYNVALSYPTLSSASLEITLQAILTSDGVNTYFIVSFDNINYIENEQFSYPPYPPALIGYYGKENIIQFPGSLDKSFAQNKLNCQSNVDVSGVYVGGLTSTSDYKGTAFGISDAVRTIFSLCSNCQGDNLPRCSSTTVAGHLTPAMEIQEKTTKVENFVTSENILPVAEAPADKPKAADDLATNKDKLSSSSTIDNQTIAGIAVSADTATAADAANTNKSSIKYSSEFTLSEDWLVRNIATRLIRDFTLALLPVVGREYVVSFDYYPTSFPDYPWNFWYNVIRFTTTPGTNYVYNGYHIPGIYLDWRGYLQIVNSLNGNGFNYFNTNPIALNQWTNIEISQRFTNGYYIYKIRINGNYVYSVYNYDAQDYYNVLVYASDNSYPTDGFIKNFLFDGGNNEQLTAVKILNIANQFQQTTVYKYNTSLSFSQVVSGSFPSNSFQTFNSIYYINVATFVGAQEYGISNYLLFMSVNFLPNSSQSLFLQAGKFEALPYKKINCMYNSFTTKMESVPTIKLGGFSNVNYQYYSSFPLMWLYNTTVNGFGVCYKEQMAFSGPKNILISYLAIVRSYSKISEANTYIFDTKLKSDAIGEGGYCEKVNFNYRYLDTPMVFVTPEVIRGADILINESMSKIDSLISWVHSIDKRFTVVCTESAMENQTHRQFPIKLHYIVVGDVDPCSMINCAEELECLLDNDLKPYCGCKSVCNERNDTVCGSNFVTYSSVCEMQKGFCNDFGNNTSIWPRLAYKGECKQYPYITGKVKLDPVQGAPGAFCKDVALLQNIFYSGYPLQVILTVSWESEKNKEGLHDASTIWSENVSVNGFKACVLVSGRHFFDNLQPPNVYWGAFQKGAFTTGYFEGGIIELPVWQTGMKCVGIPLNFTSNPILVASVSLSRGSFSDALSIWFTKTYSYTNFGYVPSYTVCVQELQNFDGIHKDVKIHYLAISQPIDLFIPEVREIWLPNFYSSDSRICTVTEYNNNFPLLPDPTILVSAVNYYTSSTDAVWVEAKNNTHVQFCVNTVNLNYGSILVHYAIFPSFCDEGYYFFEKKCYQLFNKNYTFEQAQLQCSNLSASLPVIRNQSDDYFLTSFANSAVWLGLRKSGVEWKWNNDTSSFRNWISGKPSENGNCSISKGIQGWEDVSCSNLYNVVCSKDPQLDLRYCSVFCQNGSCAYESGEVKCSCLPGYIGKWCDWKIPQACQNYTMLNDTWRRYNASSLPSAPLNVSCDNKLVGNASLWVRFNPKTGGRLWQNSCIPSRNYCGVKFPGWLSTDHPKVEDGEITADLDFFSFYCASDIGSVKVINCGNYYVYNFITIPYWSCDYGLCTE